MSIKTHSIIAQTDFADIDENYKAFEDKFKPKKTTDDCYTPENVYDVVADWAAKKYGFDRSRIVRPFWPGGDYTREKYPEGCVVLDNPPFSILSKIVKFYNANGVRFFLFAPALTIFNCSAKELNYVCCGAPITYANGAIVPTSFITNMGEYLVETAPDLQDAIKAANKANRKDVVKELPKYVYPSAVITSAAMNYLSMHHTDFKLRREDCIFIRRMDAQVETGKVLFGGGFLLSERAAAESAAAHVWQLSEREREIQRLIAEAAK